MLQVGGTGKVERRGGWVVDGSTNGTGKMEEAETG
jgi:hypothetical protein